MSLIFVFLSFSYYHFLVVNVLRLPITIPHKDNFYQLILLNYFHRSSSKVLETILHSWPKILNSKGTSSVHLEALLSLLSLMFLIDREGIMKAHCNKKDSSIVNFYINFLTDSNIELKFKLQALKLLVFFYNTEQETAKQMT